MVIRVCRIADMPMCDEEKAVIQNNNDCNDSSCIADIGSASSLVVVDVEAAALSVLIPWQSVYLSLNFSWLKNPSRRPDARTMVELLQEKASPKPYRYSQIESTSSTCTSSTNSFEIEMPPPRLPRIVIIAGKCAINPSSDCENELD